MKDFNKLYNSLKKKIKKHGFIQEDKRLNRKTYSLPGHFEVIKDPLLLVYLENQKPLNKYNADWRRLSINFSSVVSEAKDDLNSRRLMLLNDHGYYSTYQCFTHFQFVYTHRKEFDMYVYQRSSDLSKLHDDLVFFAYVMKEFRQKTETNVTKLVVIYGNLHYAIY